MGLEVPRDIPDINELERIAGYHASLVNDLYSYRREAEGRKSGEAAPSIVNAVDLVMSQNHISEAEAQHLLEDYVVQLEVEFEEIAAKCRHPLIDRYAPVLRGLMAGNLSWSMICGRYNK